MDGFATSPAESPAIKRPLSRPPLRSAWDPWILLLTFLPFGLGLFLFGGVRLWSIGPLSLCVFLALAFFWGRDRKAGTEIRLPPGSLFFSLFLLYAFIQAGLASEVPWDARIKALMITSAIGALFLWTALADRGNRWKVLLGAALLLISAVGWYVIIQHVRGSRMVLNLERPAGYEMRASGTYFCPNHFANMAAMAMCLALALLFTPEAGWPLKLISGYSFILLGWPLLLTQSRSGVLGVLAGTGSFLLLAAIRRGTRALLIALVAVPLLLGAAGWGAWRYGPHMRERVMQAVRGLDRRDDWRILAWLGTVEMIRERPVWGHGGGSFRHVEPRHQTYHWGNTAVYAHNEILQAVSEYGLVGAGLLTVGLAILCWKLFVRVRKSRRPRNALLAAGCLSVFIGSFVHALFDFNFHIYSNSQFLMLVAGVTFSCLFADREWTARPVFEGRRGTIARGLGLALAVGLFLALLRSGLSYGISFPAAAARMAEQFDRSERLYRRALRIDSGDWETRRGLANTLLQGALHLRGEEKRQRLAESLREFEFALRINPHDVEGWYRLSHVYGLLGDDEKTLECLRETVKILPNFPYYRSRLGVQLYRMGRMNEAREAFDRVLLADSSDKTARMHLREIQRRQGR